MYQDVIESKSSISTGSDFDKALVTHIDFIKPVEKSGLTQIMLDRKLGKDVKNRFGVLEESEYYSPSAIGYIINSPKHLKFFTTFYHELVSIYSTFAPGSSGKFMLNTDTDAQELIAMMAGKIFSLVPIVGGTLETFTNAIKETLKNKYNAHRRDRMKEMMELLAFKDDKNSAFLTAYLLTLRYLQPLNNLSMDEAISEAKAGINIITVAIETLSLLDNFKPRENMEIERILVNIITSAGKDTEKSNQNFLGKIRAFFNKNSTKHNEEKNNHSMYSYGACKLINAASNTENTCKRGNLKDIDHNNYLIFSDPEDIEAINGTIYLPTLVQTLDGIKGDLSNVLSTTKSVEEKAVTGLEEIERKLTQAAIKAFIAIQGLITIGIASFSCFAMLDYRQENHNPYRVALQVGIAVALIILRVRLENFSSDNTDTPPVLRE